MGNSRDAREVNNGQMAGGKDVVWYGSKEIHKGKQVVLT
jgi:hypothetical protein